MPKWTITYTMPKKPGDKRAVTRKLTEHTVGATSQAAQNLLTNGAKKITIVPVEE